MADVYCSECGVGERRNDFVRNIIHTKTHKVKKIKPICRDCYNKFYGKKYGYLDEE